MTDESAESKAPKNCIVTGASSGIGRAISLELARRGARVLLVCRNETLAQRVADEISQLGSAPPPAIYLAELSSLASVDALAREFQRTEPQLDALINNAGVLMKARQLSADGFETTFAVNYLAPYALTLALLPQLKAAPAARIVNVGSDVVRQFPSLYFDDLQLARRYGMVRAYKQSKLALTMFTFELARQLAETRVTVNCVHPGNVETNMTVHGPFIDLIRLLLPSTTAESAGRACADLALNPEFAAVSGAYFEHGKARDSGARSRDASAARKLWDLTDQLLRDARGLAARPRTLAGAP